MMLAGETATTAAPTTTSGVSTTPVACGAVLPSAQAATDMLAGRPIGFVKSAASILERAGLIGLGVALAGGREHVVRYALAGSLVIELGVVLFVLATRQQKE